MSDFGSRRERTLGVALVLVFLLGLVAIPWHQSPVSAAAPARKHCKTVKKHGKRVKVCKTVKPSKQRPPTSTPAPHSLNLPVQTDASHAASRTIGRSGGTLTATGADRTTYTLVIPKDALPGDTQISMTPIAGIPGLPMSGGFAAGVQFAPDGLTFFQPGTLTIVPATSIPTALQIPFAYQGGGTGFHLYPLTRDRTKIIFNVVHFSGYGLGTGTNADASAFGGRRQPESQNQVEQDIANVLNAARREGRDLSDKQWEKLAAKVFELYDQEFPPYFPVFETSDDEDAAIYFYQRASGILRQAFLVGSAGAQVEFTIREERLFASMLKAATHFYQKRGEKCMAHHDGQLLYGGTVAGWVINDPTDIEKRFGWARQMWIASEGATEPSVDEILAPCRPWGFKFEKVTFVQTKTDADGTTTVTDTYSGHTCGDTPWKSWTITVDRQVTAPGAGGSRSFDFSVTIPQSGEAIVASDASARVMIPAQNPAIIRFTEPLLDMFTMPQTQQDQPLLDDPSCK